MAAWLNKWLLVSILPVYLGFIQAPYPETVPVHPLHLSVAEINHNADDLSLEISCKLFTDDFEKVLRQNNPGRKIDLINPADRQAMVALVNDYMRRNLVIKVDGKPAVFECLGFEQEEDATYSYFQVFGIGSVKKIEIQNTILFDLFTDQANINHVIVGGKRKSNKLDQPLKYAVFQFN